MRAAFSRVSVRGHRQFLHLLILTVDEGVELLTGVNAGEQRGGTLAAGEIAGSSGKGQAMD
jgi:hypothetical protein